MRRRLYLESSRCISKNEKHSVSFIDDSVITCDEIMKETRTIPTNFNEQKVTCKTKNFHIFLAFLLINITLLIAVGIY